MARLVGLYSPELMDCFADLIHHQIASLALLLGFSLVYQHEKKADLGPDIALISPCRP